ncbi:hypothetical protein SPF06_12065 [Sinomonas sp. JGH33]|uniref:Uncharacterized protein n=1 Tax=Sinomonas terricola TaxID=3110330 RepID=A0ABU5T7G5_9MICC|nr:hypothetical protein [Sinomonas sp. JGH33]MEA5455459.1 hypothetical protein [Sinomonas sp. JGH33]
MKLPPSGSRTGHRATVAAVLLLNSVLMLFPPIHWAIAGLGPVGALGYALGAPLVAVVSLVVLYATQRAEEVQ